MRQPLLFEPTGLPRPTNNQQRVFRAVVVAAQPVTAADVASRLDMDQVSIYTALKLLRRRGFLRFVEGSSRLHEPVPGVLWPEDRRGKEPGSRARWLKGRAARPISQVTAARRG